MSPTRQRGATPLDSLDPVNGGVRNQERIRAIVPHGNRVGSVSCLSEFGRDARDRAHERSHPALLVAKDGLGG